MSSDSERLGTTVEAGMGSNLTQPSRMSPYTLFTSEVLASVMILGRKTLLKFVSVLNYNNVTKLQYPMVAERFLYITIIVLALEKIYPVRRVIQRNQA